MLGVNLWGVVHGMQAFVPAMLETGRPGAVINTGSKQGITNPPGDAAYNASKAAVKSMTESLAHALRQREGCAITAHLLVPGFTYTGMIAPPRAREAGGGLDVRAGRRSIARTHRLPETSTSSARTTTSISRPTSRACAGIWTTLRRRPALSRWHPDHADAFAAFMRGDGH